MAKYKPQQRRLILIDRKIREGTRFGVLPNSRLLAEQLEVSDKSIRRDIDHLRYDLGAPIEYDSRKHGFFYTERNWQMPAMVMRETDLYAVCIAEEVLKQYSGTPVYDSMYPMLEDLLRALPEDVQMDPVWINERFTFFPQPAPVVDHQVWTQVFKALRKELSLEFDYTNPGYSHSYRRTLNPYHAVSHRGQWYVLGHCHYKKEIRVFAVSRMANVVVTTNRFLIPNDFDFEAYAGKHFGIIFGDREYNVEIHFDPSAAPYVREQVWHETQTIEEGEDGSAVLRFQTNHLLEVRRWVLSWGAGAKVCAPPELRKAVRQDLKEALNGYSDGEDPSDAICPTP